VDKLRTAFNVLAAVAVIVAVASVAAGGGEVPAGILDTLGFIAIGGAAFGALVSQVLEDYDWFQKLPGYWREIVVKGITFVLPIVAALGQSFLPGELPAPFDRAWTLVVLGVLMFLGSQAWHFAANRRRA
jgi:hypothetical protein